MQILHVLKWLTPVETCGGQIRVLHLGRSLASFAEVDAVGFLPQHQISVEDNKNLKHYRQLFPIPLPKKIKAMREIACSSLAGASLRTSRFFPNYLYAYINKLVMTGGYDAIQVEELPLMSAVLKMNIDIPIVFSSHNVESELSSRLFKKYNSALRLFAGIEQRRTLKEEQKALSASASCLVVSERDRQQFKELSGSVQLSPIHVLPNGVSERFSPAKPPVKRAGILISGSFGWYPNKNGLHWFLDFVLPQIRRIHPDVPIRVAGSGIKPKMQQKLQKRGISVHCDVPDMLPFLRQAQMLLVPLHIGGGTRIKIIEAWGAGLPVVSTSLGAEGLPCSHERNILLADSPEDLANSINRLLIDAELCKTLATHGISAANGLHWSALTEPLRNVYSQLNMDKGL
ncbi:MAG: glycosyltransferase family 4 protein [Victivallaceae bacterium]|nr:glycosyltransferase family 4 protein [Victivallaceae bacterium]